jgi:hypothetical protein
MKAQSPKRKKDNIKQTLEHLEIRLKIEQHFASDINYFLLCVSVKKIVLPCHMLLKTRL